MRYNLRQEKGSDEIRVQREFFLLARESKLQETIAELDEIGANIESMRVKRGIWTTYDGFNPKIYSIRFNRKPTDDPLKEKKFINKYLELLDAPGIVSHP